MAQSRIRSNIYDLVEQAAARHGIPRLPLWQKVAKALTDGRLKAARSLSERLNGGPTLAEWLVGFQASVDRNNDPNDGGRWRILKLIIVRKADFVRLLRNTGKRRGPRCGTTGFRDADRKLFPEITRMTKGGGKARSAYGAALHLADEGKIAGTGSRETKAKRVSARYLKERW